MEPASGVVRQRHRALVLVTGFGSFEKIDSNPSGEIARRLAADPPEGTEVIAAVLPVSFGRAPEAFDELLDRVRPRSPDILLGLGVMRERGFRLELRARPRLRGRVRVDVDGMAASDAESTAHPPLRSPLESWLREWAAKADGFRVSENAGGYVCERIYHHLLVRARELECSCVFLHVPPERFTPVEEQEAVVRLFLDALPKSGRAT